MLWISPSPSYKRFPSLEEALSVGGSVHLSTALPGPQAPGPGSAPCPQEKAEEHGDAPGPQPVVLYHEC